tara:strand:- start:57 stop:716 length:660 start_codon:yes stop_codon:yes gene_type:complete
MFDRVMLPPPPPPTASVTPTLEPETSLGDRLRGMGGIFANAIAPGDVGYEDLVAETVPTGGRPAPTPYVIGKLLGGAGGSGSTPAMPVGIDSLLGGGKGDPANIPMPSPPPVIERPPIMPPQPPIMRPPLPPPPPPPPPPVVATPALRKPLPLPPVTTPDKTRAAATPKPFVAPDLSALLPVKPRTQKVTKPKRGRKKVVEPDQRSSRKKRKRRQRGPR